MENPMPYEVTEEITNNTNIALINESQIFTFFLGVNTDGSQRTLEEQAERVRTQGVSMGLSEEECNEVKSVILEYQDNTTITNLDINTQIFTKTTIYPTESVYNNIVAIRNSITGGGLSWTVISKQTV